MLGSVEFLYVPVVGFYKGIVGLHVANGVYLGKEIYE